MKKSITLFIVAFLVLTLFSILYSFAQERITLTTYYPAPYGVYRELRADQMAIGSAYRYSPLSDGEFIVNASVGIGTDSPQAKLDVRGNFTVTGNIVATANIHDGCEWTGWVQAGFGSGTYQQLCPEGKYQAGMEYNKHRDDSGDKDWYSYRLYCCEL